jgi:hypothetical protein
MMNVSWLVTAVNWVLAGAAPRAMNAFSIMNSLVDVLAIQVVITR